MVKAKLLALDGPANGSGPASFGALAPRGELFAGAMTPCVAGLPVEDGDVQVLSTWEDGSAALLRVTLLDVMTSTIAGAELTILARPPQEPRQIFDGRTKRKEMLTKYNCKVIIVDGGGAQWVAEVTPDQSWQVLQAIIDAKDQGAARRCVDFTLAPRAISDHPQLRVHFRWVAYSGWLGARCEVGVENCLVDPGRPTQDLSISRVEVYVDGNLVVQRGPYQHDHGTLWRCTGWSGEAAPLVVAVPDGASMADIPLCPDWDWQRPASQAEVINLRTSLQKATVKGGSKSPQRGASFPVTSLEQVHGVPSECWPLWGSQGDTGDRPDIGWAPTWTAALLNGATPEAALLQLQADGNGSAAFNVHFRAGDDQPMGLVFSHPFIAKQAIPRKSRFVPDAAHHVTTGLWSLIMTGEERYWDELRAWACYCVRLNYPNDGTLQTPGDRREAWAIRSISAAILLCPEDDAFRAYGRTCLERTAAEWLKQLPGLQSTLPLGQLSKGDWKPSGRDQYLFTFVGSPWQQAWFLATAMAADAILGEELFRPVVEQGWKFFQLYATSALGTFVFDLDMLADYSVPTQWFTPKPDATGSGVTVSKEGPAFTDANDFAHACRVALVTHKPRLLSSDIPADADPTHFQVDTSVPYVGSQFHEYGLGRCGTHLLAKKLGLPSAQEVLASFVPVYDAAANRTSRAPYARVKERA